MLGIFTEIFKVLTILDTGIVDSFIINTISRIYRENKYAYNVCVSIYICSTIICNMKFFLDISIAVGNITRLFVEETKTRMKII